MAEGDRLEEITPTWRQRATNALQNLLVGFGSDKYSAGKFADSLLGGPRSNLPLQMGLADPTPIGAFFGQEEADSPFAPKGLASLYPASLQRDLYITHRLETPSRVQDMGKLPYEVTHMSSGITRGDLMQKFASAPTGLWFVPNVERIGPDTGLSSIINRDSYSMRGKNLPMQRADDWITARQMNGGYGSVRPIEEEARNRLASRFATSIERGGPKTEGSFVSGVLDTPLGWEFDRRAAAFDNGGGNFHDLLLHESPRFNTIRGFENSPRGAGLLRDMADPDSIGGHAAASNWEQSWKNLISDLQMNAPNGDLSLFLDPIRDLTSRNINLARGLAGMNTSRSPDSAIVRYLSSINEARPDPSAPLNPLLLSPMNRYRGAQVLHSGNNADVANQLLNVFYSDPLASYIRDEAQPQMQALLKELPFVPSSYAEHKTFGPVGLNPFNFRGIIADEKNPWKNELGLAASKRQMPLAFTSGDLQDRTDVYEELLNRPEAFLRRPRTSGASGGNSESASKLTTGLAASANPPSLAKPADLLQTHPELGDLSLSNHLAGNVDYLSDDWLKIINAHIQKKATLGALSPQLQGLQSALNVYQKHLANLNAPEAIAGWSVDKQIHDVLFKNFLKSWDNVKGSL